MKKDKADKKERTYSEGQVTVLLENIRAQQKAIFDGQEFIKSKIEAIEVTQARSWEKLTQIDLRLIKVEKKLEEIDLRLSNFDKRLVHLENSR